MATPNLIRRQRLSEVVDAFKRMQTVAEAKVKVSEEIAKEKKEEEAD